MFSSIESNTQGLSSGHVNGCGYVGDQACCCSCKPLFKTLPMYLFFFDVRVFFGIDIPSESI